MRDWLLTIAEFAGMLVIVSGIGVMALAFAPPLP